MNNKIVWDNALYADQQARTHISLLLEQIRVLNAQVQELQRKQNTVLPIQVQAGDTINIVREELNVYCTSCGVCLSAGAFHELDCKLLQ